MPSDKKDVTKTFSLPMNSDHAVKIIKLTSFSRDFSASGVQTNNFLTYWSWSKRFSLYIANTVTMEKKSETDTELLWAVFNDNILHSSIYGQVKMHVILWHGSAICKCGDSKHNLLILLQVQCWDNIKCAGYTKTSLVFFLQPCD